MTPRTAGAALLLCALASGNAGCWVPMATGRQMQADIRSIQSDLQTANKGLEEQRARLTETMDRAEKQIDEVAGALAELRSAAHNTDADFGVQMERLIREVQELRGAIELTDYRLGKLEAAVNTQTPAAAGGGDGAGATAATAAASPAPAVPQDQKGMLQYAANLVKQGKLVEARGVYRDVTKKWPNVKGVTDVAYYEIGELYYAEKSYRDALPQYIKVAEKFKSGSLLDDALFKIGMCSFSIGNLQDAKIFFEEIVTKHKSSPHAKEAAKKVAEINKLLEREKKRKSSGKKGRHH